MADNEKNNLNNFDYSTSFYFGFAFKSIIADNLPDDMKMKRVTGIGGIFFKMQKS